MNSKEEETGRPYKLWRDLINIVKKDSNELRLRFDINLLTDFMTPPIEPKQKFKIGDLEYHSSYRPLNALGQFQTTNKFRKELKILYHDQKIIKSIFIIQEILGLFNGAIIKYVL
jgi:hypothetical protein